MTDPNPLATGPTKGRADHCVTHHYACDCREWEHVCVVERLESRLAAANALLRYLSRYLDPRHYAEAIKKIDEHLQGAGDEA
ncbi:MAG TPA: hypothetical protein VN731_10340 [Rhodanobacter sp.]|nr:hypothetical protein [Rhodanobacter sp.]